MSAIAIGPKTGKGELKYISAVETHCMIPAVDDKGKPVYKTDARGNNSIRVFKQILFVYVPPSVATASNGTRSTRQRCWYLVIGKERNGQYYDALKKDLDERTANPSNRLFTEADFFKKRNPEAFGIAQDNAKLVEEVKGKDAKIADLEKRLGLSKDKKTK